MRFSAEKTKLSNVTSTGNRSISTPRRTSTQTLRAVCLVRVVLFHFEARGTRGSTQEKTQERGRGHRRPGKEERGVARSNKWGAGSRDEKDLERVERNNTKNQIANDCP